MQEVSFHFRVREHFVEEIYVTQFVGLLNVPRGTRVSEVNEPGGGGASVGRPTIRVI
jgi:hypothetical protein